MTGTYTKLRSGEWGVRLAQEAKLKPGDTVTVVKKSGESKVETVRSVVWSGQGITLLAIEIRDRNGHSHSWSRSRWGCENGQCYCPQCSSGSECLCRCSCGFGG